MEESDETMGDSSKEKDVTEILVVLLPLIVVIVVLLLLIEVIEETTQEEDMELSSLSGLLGDIKSLAASDLKKVKTGAGHWVTPVTCVAGQDGAPLHPWTAQHPRTPSPWALRAPVGAGRSDNQEKLNAHSLFM